MRDCLIIGSGRSGTSMMASLFAQTGYFMGDNVRPPDQANRRGYFESVEVNQINEDLLDQVIPTRPSGRIGWRIYRRRPRRMQRWVTRPRRSSYQLAVSAELRERIERQAKSPFCLKDPRFCWTLPAWQGALGDLRLVCVFRHPAETIDSMFKLSRIQAGMRDYAMRRDELERVWRDMYRNVIRWSDAAPESWLFLNYEDVLRGPAPVARLAEFVEAPLEAGLIDATVQSVKRQQDTVPPQCRETYAELRRRSGASAAAPQ